MNPLTDLIPARARKYVYAAAAVLAFGYGIWQATDGDWGQFIAGLLAAVVSALAHGNTSGTEGTDVPDGGGTEGTD